jgi:hypothetical protein
MPAKVRASTCRRVLATTIQKEKRTNNNPNSTIVNNTITTPLMACTYEETTQSSPRLTGPNRNGRLAKSKTMSTPQATERDIV